LRACGCLADDLELGPGLGRSLADGDAARSTGRPSSMPASRLRRLRRLQRLEHPTPRHLADGLGRQSSGVMAVGGFEYRPQGALRKPAHVYSRQGGPPRHLGAAGASMMRASSSLRQPAPDSRSLDRGGSERRQDLAPFNGKRLLPR
jgi:hypothetical protein